MTWLIVAGVAAAAVVLLAVLAWRAPVEEYPHQNGDGEH